MTEIVAKEECPVCQGKKRDNKHACERCGGLGTILTTLSLKDLTSKVAALMRSKNSS